MTSHELAKILLANRDLAIATHANNHTYMSGTDSESHGLLKVGLLESCGEQHIIIGNMSKKNINKPNWYISEMIHGNVPEEWETQEEWQEWDNWFNKKNEDQEPYGE